MASERLEIASVSNSIDSKSATRDGKKRSTVRRVYSLSDFPDLPRPKRKVASTFFGLLRSPESLTPLEWFYLAISIVSIGASFVFTILRVVALSEAYRDTKNVTAFNNDSHDESDEYVSVKADYTFSILFIWTAFFALYHVLFGVFCSRKGDMIIYIFSTTIVWAYVVINYLTSSNQSTKEVRLIVSSAIAPFIIAIGIKLAIRYSSSNQLVYALVGPDPEAQEMYRWVLFHDCVVKFDLQMAGSVLILWQQKSFLQEHPDTYEIIIGVVGLGLGVTWLTIAYLAVRLERKPLVLAFYVLSVVSPVEVIWNIVRLAQLANVAKSLLISTIVCGAVAILTRGVSVYTMRRVSQNFDKGIKDLSKYKAAKRQVDNIYSITVFKAELTYGSAPGNSGAVSQ